MMAESLSVLLVEDNRGDADLIREYLDMAANGTRFDIRHVERVNAALEDLAAQVPDLVLLDLSLPDSQGLKGLERLRSSGVDVPVIVLTGQTDEEVAWTAVQQGAQDYLLKDEISPGILRRAIRYAVERARSAEALRREEAWLRTIVESVSDAIVVLDGAGTIQYESPALGRILGRDVGELMGTAVLDLVHPDDLEYARDLLADVTEGGLGSRVDTKVRVRHADGSWRRVAGRAVNLLEEPAVGGIVLTVRDVTEREQRREELERRTAQLAERVKEQRCLYSVLHELHRAPGGEGLDETFRQVVELIPPGFHYPEIMAASLTIREQRYETGSYRDTPWSLDTEILEDGEAVGRLEVAFVEQPPDLESPFLEEEYWLVRAIGEEIGETLRFHRMHETLERNEAYFRTLTEHSTDIIAITDAEGVIQYVSPSLEQVAGRPIEEAVGRDAFANVHPEDVHRVEAMFEELKRAPSAVGRVEARARDGSGAWRTVEFTGRNMLHDAAIGGVVLNARDVTERRTAERALRASEERFRLVARASSDVIFEHEFATDALWWSDAFTEMFGYAEGEEPDTFDAWAELVHPSERDRILTEVQAAAEDPSVTSWKGEYRIRRADGSYADVFSRARFLRDEAGRPTRVVGAVMDITERKRAERARRRSEEKYRTLFETMGQGVVYQDSDGAVIAVNPAMERILGRSASELASGEGGMPRWRAVREDGSALADEEHPASVALRTGQEVNDVIIGFENPRDERIRWVEVDARPQFRPPDERPHQVYTTFEDITERMEAEEALRRRDAILEAVSFAAARFLTTDDLDGSMEQVLAMIGGATDAAEVGVYEAVDLGDEGVRGRLRYRWRSGDMRGESIQDHGLGADPAGWAERLRAGQVVQGPVDRFDGQEREYLESEGMESIAVVPIFVGEEWWGSLRLPDRRRRRQWSSTELDALRTAAATLGAAFRRRNAEAALRERDEQLLHAQKLEAVGRLAGGIAHDFNNLLTAVAGHSDFLLKHLEPDEELREEVREIERAADRAARLTRQLLTFSRKQVVEERVIDMGRVVRDMEPMLRRLIGEHIHLEVHSEEGEAILRADPGQLQQVLMNLSLNGRDAMRDGGRLQIRVGVRAVEDDELAGAVPSQAEAGAYAALVVSDSGVGMDRETLDRIFEPFFTTKDPNKGTGLGLSTVYGIVRRMRGYIHVDSEESDGTTFTILLPLADAPLEADGQDEDDNVSLTGDEAILVAEDEETVRAVTVRMLRSRGYRVLEAENGRHALELAEAHPEIDLLLSDVVMPDLGGVELAARLRKRSPGIRILLTSGYTDDELVQHGIDQEELAFIEKPYSPASLARKVRAVLDA